MIDENIGSGEINDNIASTIHILISTDKPPTIVPPIPLIELSIGKLNTRFNTICKI